MFKSNMELTFASQCLLHHRYASDFLVCNNMLRPLLGIPFGAWLAFNWDFGLDGLWIGLTVSLVYCAVFGTLLCVRTDWDHEVRKVVARINAESKARGSEDDV